jgi:hypothetical protein
MEPTQAVDLNEAVREALKALAQPRMTLADKTYVVGVLQRVGLAIQGMPIMEQAARNADRKADRDHRKIQRLKELVSHLVDKL